MVNTLGNHSSSVVNTVSTQSSTSTSMANAAINILFLYGEYQEHLGFYLDGEYRDYPSFPTVNTKIIQSSTHTRVNPSSSTVNTEIIQPST